MSDDEAWEAFKAIRWADNQGEPYCPKCGCVAVYQFRARRLFKCQACKWQFTVTSGTIFASRKMAVRDILGAVAIFVNGAKGHSALQLSRDLDCQYKTAFVLLHKLREALGVAAGRSPLKGDIEIDGAYFGGYVKPANWKANRVDRRTSLARNGKRQVVVVMRERDGKTLPFVAKSRSAGVPMMIAANVAEGSTIFADEASSWDDLEARFLTKRINHSVCYSDGNSCTNMGKKSFFSRIRRAGSRHPPPHRRPLPRRTPPKWRGARIGAGCPTARNNMPLADGGELSTHPVSRPGGREPTGSAPLLGRLLHFGRNLADRARRTGSGQQSGSSLGSSRWW